MDKKSLMIDSLLVASDEKTEGLVSALATLKERKKNEFFSTNAGEPFGVPESVRYKMYMERIEEDHKRIIKRMWDRSSTTYWLQLLYPLVCVILAALDTANLPAYLLTAVGGGTALKGVRTMSRNSFQKNNPQSAYKPLKLKNGGKDGDVDVDVSKPHTATKKENPVTGSNEEESDMPEGD